MTIWTIRAHNYLKYAISLDEAKVFELLHREKNHLIEQDAVKIDSFQILPTKKNIVRMLNQFIERAK